MISKLSINRDVFNSQEICFDDYINEIIEKIETLETRTAKKRFVDKLLTELESRTELVSEVCEHGNIDDSAEWEATKKSLSICLNREY